MILLNYLTRNQDTHGMVWWSETIMAWFWFQCLKNYHKYTRPWRLRHWKLQQHWHLHQIWDFIGCPRDSLVLATVLINNSSFFSSNGLLIEYIRFNASFFNQLLYSHVKKEGNKVAHKLARHALCISNFSV